MHSNCRDAAKAPSHNFYSVLSKMPILGHCPLIWPQSHLVSAAMSHLTAANCSPKPSSAFLLTQCYGGCFAADHALLALKNHINCLASPLYCHCTPEGLDTAPHTYG